MRKRGTQSQATGSPARWYDTLGNLVRFRLMPGKRHDSVEAPPLADGIAFDGLIADKALESYALDAELNERGARS